jgi:uncharacterized membrane protein YcaP (DUF421 family)
MNIKFDEIFFNDFSLEYAIEITVRTLLMFLFVLLMLRLSGKKGIRQLSIFEVAIIIALGSAAGDPMFNKDMAILPSLMVFAVILGFYRLLTYLAFKSEKFESVLEGEPIYIIEDGEFSLQGKDNTFAKDEFFAEMRVNGIEHVGQVKTAILETNGQISFFYFDDKEVKPGLPVLPKIYAKKSTHVTAAGSYACTNCGHVEHLESDSKCMRCEEKEWVRSLDHCRVK